MLESIRKMWRIPDLRNKILYTLGMLLLFRLVGVIPAPGVDAVKVLSSKASDLPLLQLMLSPFPSALTYSQSSARHVPSTPVPLF